MVHISTVDRLEKRTAADLLVIPFWQGKKHAEAVESLKEFSSFIAPSLKSGDFLGKEGETLILYNHKKEKETRLLCLGLGDKKKLTLESLRRAYSAVVRFCQRKKLKQLNVFIPKELTKDAEAICEGLLLTNYAYVQLKEDSLKEDPHALLEKICFISTGQVSFKKTETVISAVNFARDLVNGNADEITPDALVAIAQDLEKKHKKIKTTVLRKKQLEKEKLGLLLAVSRGASLEPALITLEYRGNPQSSESTAIVGKGVTYDTGGLNLKPTGSMETMKCDMAGSATVLGVLQAAAEMQLKVNIIGVIAATENAIGPLSYKPGDVYRSYTGKTVEISNTDAEGRLILADALAYAQEKHKPTQIIDLATLTGGIVIALGEEITGLFSNNDKLSHQLIHAGEKTHERLWRMPLLPEYKEQLKSNIADIKNSGGRRASSATAAIFIQQFIKDLPWAHLDIAGTAYLSETKHYHTTPATGMGIRLLIEFLSCA